MIGFDLTEEQRALRDLTRQFAREAIIPIATECDRTERFPWEVHQKAFDLGLMTACLPSEYGGGGLGLLEGCLVAEELNYACAGIAGASGATFLACTPLLVAGTPDQKERFLRPMCQRLTLAAFCTTEPGAGSDVAAIATTAKRVGDQYVISGSKRFISNGSHARWYAVFATVDRSLGHKGLCAFIVPSDLPGVVRGRREDKMGQRAADTAEVFFEDVRVPESNRLGAEGDGFRIAMQAFDLTRPWIGAQAVGVARRALDEALQYARGRSTFGAPIADHQAIQFMLADMAMEIEATRLLTYKAAWLHDQGRSNTVVASYAKAFGADMAMRVTTNAVQVLGGYGYIKDYPVEKLMRDAKLLQIYEGTSQIQRLVIARRLVRGEGEP
jgi:acyl-CoA dehydrogenase